jgi:hypothetical protein
LTTFIDHRQLAVLSTPRFTSPAAFHFACAAGALRPGEELTLGPGTRRPRAGAATVATTPTPYPRRTGRRRGSGSPRDQ